MSNLKHGFYSKNENINPDSIMMRNTVVKQLLRDRQQDIIDIACGKIVKPGVYDLASYLIDCALPHNEELLPKSHIDLIKELYHSRSFKVLREHNKHKSLNELLDFAKSFE